jgi:hypothetical protein
MTRFEAAFVLAALIEYAAVQVRNSRRPLWFDELFTFYIARLPDTGQLFRAIPGDGNPPLNYLLARLSLDMFGETPFAVRLSSIVGCSAALLATYFFVRRFSGPVFGLFSLLALAFTTMAARYGAEGRPYALLLGFTGLTMVSWQAAAEEKRPRLVSLLGVTLGIAGAICSHHFGAIHVGIPLLFGEAVRLVRRRKFDIPLYCAGAAGASMLAVTIPFASATHRVMLDYVKQSATFWAKPTIGSLDSYASMVCWWLPALFLALLFLTKQPGEPAGEKRGPAAHEIAAASGLALLVPIMTCITWFATGYYLDRYAIGAAMGVSLLMGLTAPSLGRNRSHATAVAALCVIGALVWPPVVIGSKGIGRLMGNGPPATAAAVLGTVPGREPIVVASALTYMPEWWYASAQLRERIHYLADLPFAVRQPDFLPELSLVVNQSCVPSKVDDYRQFVTTHHRFLLYAVGEPRVEWTVNRLLSEGWSLQTIRTSGKAVLYVADAHVR